MPKGDTWEADVTARFALRMRRERDRRGWSATKLAAECDALGFEIQPNVIRKLEGGYRKYVTITEWMAISAALDVPPPLFLVPIGLDLPSRGGRSAIGAIQTEGPGFVSYEFPIGGPLVLDPVEILPGLVDESSLAFEWLSGDAHLTIERGVNPDPWKIIRVWRFMLQGLRTYLERRVDTLDPATEAELSLLRIQIREGRRALRHLGMTPPALPSTLAPTEVSDIDGDDGDA